MRSFVARAAAVTAALIAMAAAAGPASAGASHALIQGSGSSWSANAVNQWIADVQSNGLQVVYTPSGSAQGRKDFAFKTTDFAVSEIGYQGTDPVTGGQDNSLGRAFSYLPVVAGGTSFPYQITVGGQQVRNLRLSGATLAKIFTNQVTNWNDPAVTADNNGRQLPSLPIIPVVHSEGSGTSAQFTRYLDSLYPTIWRPYQGRSGFTEYYPRKGTMIAQSGSDGVMNFISSRAANGSIGFDEYSYALAKNYPVAKLENAAGYFTLPTQYNVAVALTNAKINLSHNDPDCPTGPANCYLLQNLDDVYTDSDQRAYPMSSYSYMIIPTASDDSKMTTAKRQTLADFLFYSVCEGQKEMGPIGYSPLPINLVQASFDQINALQTADPDVDLTQRSVATCQNPTFIAGEPTTNHLAEIAPMPPTCDQSGQGPCSGDGDPGTTNPPPSSGASAGPSAQPTTGQGKATATGTPTPRASGPPKKGAASPASTGSPTSAAAAKPTASGKVDPVTGQVVPGSGGTATGGGAGTTGSVSAIAGDNAVAPGSGSTAASVNAVSVAADLPVARPDTMAGLLAPLAVLLLLVALVVPPVLGRRFVKPPERRP
jgi:phosphate transport system substrate-binding protein